MEYQKVISFKTATIISMFIMLGLAACRHVPDPRMTRVDSIMEAYPDSALSILDTLHLADKASDYDRALYGMLLTHARYKNFIDETDDSLINASVDFFLYHGDKEKAARSLFLKGMSI